MPVLLGAAAVLLAAGCGENGTGPAQIKKGLEEEVRDEGGDRIVFAGSLEGENEEKAREMAAQSIVRLEVEESGTGTVYFGSGSNTAAFSMETINEGYEEIFGEKRNTEEYRQRAG